MMVVVGAFFTRIGVCKSWEESSEESSFLEQHSGGTKITSIRGQMG